MKNFFRELLSYVLIALAVILFRTYIASPANVNGSSMEPTLKNHNIVIVNKLYLRVNDIKRFDIVVIKNKEDNDKIIKRVIGLPNEKIEYKDNILYINDKVAKCNIKFESTEDFVYETKDNEYFVLGDNRSVSKDSRYFGAFNKEEIIGLVKFRIYPFDKFGSVR